MPLIFRKIRYDSAAMGRMRKYLWYAIGEVVLIFVGITLALAFGDMQEERRTRAEEISSLHDIAQNLQANISLIGRTIGIDKDRLINCREAIAIVEARSPWQPDYGTVFEGCRWWTSPYLNSAAYDSLKAKGTDLISNPEVRSTIVNLYDDVYAVITQDIDREQWEFQSAVVLTLWNRFFRTSPGQPAVASDYDALLDSGEFLNMLYNRSDFLDRSIREQKRSLSRTAETHTAIEAELRRIASD